MKVKFHTSLFGNADNHALSIFQHIFIGKADHLETVCFQISLTTQVGLSNISVVSTVDLDDQIFFLAKEINNKRTD